MNSLQGTENTKYKRQPELLRLTSGNILIIDQFMMANDQFFLELENGTNFIDSLSQQANNWGGGVVKLQPGDYKVERDPLESTILVCPENPAEPDPDSQSEIASLKRENFSGQGRVFVDTRCLVILDCDHLSDSSLFKSYQQKRKEAGEKAARDFLRSSGAAVRYGFNRFGDELGIFVNNDSTSLALWPDVVDQVAKN